jgi:hypothetical protein
VKGSERKDLHADRLGALVELAKLRSITLDEVMSQLGIQFPNKVSDSNFSQEQV